jgi:hypothetical protein
MGCGSRGAQPAAPSAATAPEDPSEHQSVAPNCRAEVKNLCKAFGPVAGGSRNAFKIMKRNYRPPAGRPLRNTWSSKVLRNTSPWLSIVDLVTRF